MRTFGTQVINELVLGGRAVNLREVEKNYTTREIEEILFDSTTRFVGGMPEMMAEAEATENLEMRIGVWMQTIEHFPKTLHYGMISTSELLQSNFFPEDQAIDSKRETLKRLTNKQLPNVCTR